VDSILEIWNSNTAFAQDLEYDLKDPNTRAVLEKSDPRAWWRYAKAKTLTLDHGATLEVVREALKKQRFDVCPEAKIFFVLKCH